MENEFSNNFENEFNDSSLKSLEEFFSKEINNSLTPQEIMVTSFALHHIANILVLYNTYSNVAIFDTKIFIEKYPEYANIDFKNLQDLDKDTLKSIENALHEVDGTESEEFNKGDILIKNIIKVILNISLKLYNSYIKEYTEQTPEDTEQFFTILDNCLQNSLSMLQVFFTQKF